MNSRPFPRGLRPCAALCAVLICVAATVGAPTAPLPDEQYVLGPDSQPQPGVPKGTMTEFHLDDSKAFPGFQRSWWLYVPAHYDGRTPLPLMIFNDGGGYAKRDGTWRVPVVLDNLIARRELPAMAVVFVDPGDSPLAPGEMPRVRPDGRSQAPRNRGVEYDLLGSRYAGFVVDELLPLVQEHVAITDDPNGRGIAGSSSGGICAFTVAWERPDQFRRVITAVGSFVRRGATYPDLVRSTPRKPLKVFQQDGANDQVNEAGNWPESNRALARALDDMGYEHVFVMGVGTHNPRHFASILPEAMRWLWRDYPR